MHEIITYWQRKVTKAKMFYSTDPGKLRGESGQNDIILFAAVIYECLWYVRILVPRKPFQPSLMFKSKARAYQCEATLSYLGSWPYK